MLGELEQLVLLAVLQAGGQPYGVEVVEEIRRRTGREPLLATVHKTLSRLEEKGLVASHLGEPTAVRGGRRRRHYAVTRAGRAAVRESFATLRRMAHGLAVGWDAP